MTRQTTLSPCRLYRYTLWRFWNPWLFMEKSIPPKGFVMFIGLNPSTADETEDDPTIRRCVGFAKRWGYTSICMTNLFAWRSTDPRALTIQRDPIGPENDRHLLECAQEADMVVAAWGNAGGFPARPLEVKAMIPNLKCLQLTKHGNPGHPLYLPKTLTPIDFP